MLGYFFRPTIFFCLCRIYFYFHVSRLVLKPIKVMWRSCYHRAWDLETMDVFYVFIYLFIYLTIFFFIRFLLLFSFWYLFIFLCFIVLFLFFLFLIYFYFHVNISFLLSNIYLIFSYFNFFKKKFLSFFFFIVFDLLLHGISLYQFISDIL